MLLRVREKHLFETGVENENIFNKAAVALPIYRFLVPVLHTV
jgi:hypothetical protein